MDAIKILIATPTYDGNVRSEYMLGVRNLEIALNARGLGTELKIINGTLLPQIRNVFVNLLLIRQDLTHLLFIDADMVFSPGAVEKLIGFGKPFSGCLYPAKMLDLDQFYNNSQTSSSSAEARALTQPFVATNYLQMERHDHGERYVIKDGFIRTLELGCGVTLIHRSVIETIAAQCDDILLKLRMPEYVGFLGDNDVTLAFDPLRSKDGRPLAEDLSFCYRWTQICGGEIWALVDEAIGHVGTMIYQGRAQDHLLVTWSRAFT